MLGKLLKYEIRATSRIYLPLLGVLLALAGSNKLFLWISEHSDASWARYVSAALTVAFVLTMVALAIVALVVTIQRFYRNLLGDEGYLMFTLPVSADQLILSKLITSVMWLIITGLTAFSSIVFLVLKGHDWNELLQLIPQLNEQLWNRMGIHGWNVVVAFLLVLVVSVFYEILLYYAAISLGHLSNKHRFLYSVCAFIGLNIAIQLITTTLGVENLDRIRTLVMEKMTIPGAFWLLVGALLLYEIVLSTVLFFLSRSVLKYRLNLQ